MEHHYNLWSRPTTLLLASISHALCFICSLPFTISPATALLSTAKRKHTLVLNKERSTATVRDELHSNLKCQTEWLLTSSEKQCFSKIRNGKLLFPEKRQGADKRKLKFQGKKNKYLIIISENPAKPFNIGLYNFTTEFLIRCINIKLVFIVALLPTRFP